MAARRRLSFQFTDEAAPSSKEGVTLARHASLLGSQFEIDDTLGRSREARDIPCTRKLKGQSAERLVPQTRAAAPVKELSTPTIRISRRSSVLRPASARYVPRSAIHSMPIMLAKGV